IRRPSRIQSNRISKTPSRSGPMNVFGLTIVVSTAATRQSASASIFDSPYQPTPTSGSSSSIGCFSGTPRTRVPSSAEDVLGPADVDRSDRRPGCLDRQRRGGMDDHVGARDQLADALSISHVASELLDRTLELDVVQRHHVQRAHGVPLGEQPSREVQAEEARAAGDRPEHQLLTLLAAGGAGAGRAGGFASTSTAAASRTAIPTMLSPTRLARSRTRTPPSPRATAVTATSLCSPPHPSASETSPILTRRTWP